MALLTAIKLSCEGYALAQWVADGSSVVESMGLAWTLAGGSSRGRPWTLAGRSGAR